MSTPLSTFGFPPSAVLHSIEQIISEWSKVETERLEWQQTIKQKDAEIDALKHKVSVLEYGIKHERSQRLGSPSDEHSSSQPIHETVSQSSPSAAQASIQSTETDKEASNRRLTSPTKPHTRDEREAQGSPSHQTHNQANNQTSNQSSVNQSPSRLTQPTLSSKRKINSQYHTLPSRLNNQSNNQAANSHEWKDNKSPNSGSSHQAINSAKSPARSTSTSRQSPASTLNQHTSQSVAQADNPSTKSSRSASRSVSPAPSLTSPLKFDPSNSPSRRQSMNQTNNQSVNDKLHPSPINQSPYRKFSLKKKQLSFSKNPLESSFQTVDEDQTIRQSSPSHSQSVTVINEPPSQRQSISQSPINHSNNHSASAIKTFVQFKQIRPKLSLKNHVDSIRFISFDQSTSHTINQSHLILGSCSEDGTAKLWNATLALTISPTINKKAPIKMIEPFATFRAHDGPVLSMSINQSINLAITSGADGWVHAWDLPSVDSDPYAPFGRYDPGRRDGVHHDAPVWNVLIHARADDTPFVHCACADGSVYSYDAYLHSMAPRHVISPPATMVGSRPTSLCLTSDGSQLVAGYSSGHVAFIDVERGIIVSLHFDDEGIDGTADSLYVTSICPGPTSTSVYSSHVDGSVRLYDSASTTQCGNVIKAHSDCATSVSFDPAQCVLASASHDETIRLWETNNSNKLLQSLEAHQTHRSKWDEAIHAVAWAPAGRTMTPVLASAGADAVIKLYSC